MDRRGRCPLPAECIGRRPVLVADTNLGIPTIHSNFGAEVEHRGFGLMEVKGGGYGLSFRRRWRNAADTIRKGGTRLYIEGTYAYETSTVHEKLLAYLPNSAASPVPESSAKTPIEKQIQEFRRGLGHSPAPRNRTVIRPLCRTSSC